MKVFVTGATGVIGTRAVPALVAAGHEVTAVARGEAKADLVRSLGAVPVAVDLFDPAAVKEAVAGHDAVAHLATNIPPMTKASRPSSWTTNERLRREASRNLVDAALDAGAGRYVQESICFPYLDAGDAWIDEESPIEHDGVFEHLHPVWHAARDQDALPRPDLALLTAHDEAEPARDDRGYLLVRMLVLGDDGARRERDLRERERLAVEHAAPDAVVQALERLVVPAEDLHRASLCQRARVS